MERMHRRFSDQANAERVSTLEYFVVDTSDANLFELVDRGLFDVKSPIELPEGLWLETPTPNTEIAVSFFEQRINYDSGLGGAVLDNLQKSAELKSTDPKGYEYRIPNTAELLFVLDKFYKAQKPINKLPFGLSEFKNKIITSSDIPEEYVVVDFEAKGYEIQGININIVSNSQIVSGVIGFPFLYPR